MYAIGLDPGGQKAFGWCLLKVGNSEASVFASGVANSALEAVRCIANNVAEPPLACGIDAPLYWIDSGDREADKHVRKLIVGEGGHAGTVSHVNSLRGACLAQGIIAANHVASTWPGVAITEAHPKALRRLDENSTRFLPFLTVALSSDHERDAVLAAFSATCMLMRTRGWVNLLKLEEGEKYFPGPKNVDYWFPEYIPNERTIETIS